MYISLDILVCSMAVFLVCILFWLYCILTSPLGESKYKQVCKAFNKFFVIQVLYFCAFIVNVINFLPQLKQIM